MRAILFWRKTCQNTRKLAKTLAASRSSAGVHESNTPCRHLANPKRAPVIRPVHQCSRTRIHGKRSFINLCLWNRNENVLKVFFGCLMLPPALEESPAFGTSPAPLSRPPSSRPPSSRPSSSRHASTGVDSSPSAPSSPTSPRHHRPHGAPRPHAAPFP